MNEHFQFTRYMYEKSEVEIALIIAILNKTDDALFWAYELYYSGCITELIELLWKIYYDFYATLNASFEKYLYNKLKSGILDAQIICSIINNFMIRPYTIDVFILRQLVKQLDSEVDGNDKIADLLHKEDFISLAYLILNTTKSTSVDTISDAIVFFNCAGLTLNSTNEINSYNKITKVIPFIHPHTILLSRVIHWFVLVKKIKLGKNLFVHTDPSEIVMYETILTDLTPQGNTSKYPLLPILQARNILPQAAIYQIDQYNYLSLFKTKRETNNIVQAYNYNWEYYASFSPLWQRRIQKCNGIIDNNSKSIRFDDEDDMEKFYLHYGLDTEEQPTRIQEKCIKPIVKEQTWTGFYNKHKKTGIVDIDNEYLNELECVEY
jgi:hypothetical protein